MSQQRFAWALSFLDLFTCALGGVFILILIASKHRTAVMTSEPGHYLFLTAEFGSKADLNDVKISPTPNFNITPHAVGKRVVLSAERSTMDTSIKPQPPVWTICFKNQPKKLTYATEVTVRHEVNPGEIANDPPIARIQGSGYAVEVKWGEKSWRGIDDKFILRQPFPTTMPGQHQ